MIYTKLQEHFDQIENRFNVEDSTKPFQNTSTSATATTRATATTATTTTTTKTTRTLSPMVAAVRQGCSPSYSPIVTRPKILKLHYLNFRIIPLIDVLV